MYKVHCLLLLVAALSSSCVVGVRHQQVQSQQFQHGQQGEVSGSATGIEFGVVADFRYFRLAFPYEGLGIDITGSAEPNGYFKKKDVNEFRAFRLDIPLISLRDFENGGSFKYPGIMRHRQSLEIWTGAAAEPSSTPNWWADVGLVYYHHNAIAVRLYGGYGQIPFRETMLGRNDNFSANDKTWQGHAGGLAMGLEITLFAGEHALDLIKYILVEDKRVRDTSQDW
ncbi:MAG: hypothetical protein H0U74_07220 [Bradymonadaceae bacterium]|nr:hypothetical protein [Lujinxingiaceae bacterium]